MKTIFAVGAYGLAACLMTGFRPATTAADTDPAAWNRKAAAAYLDQRADWWMKWPGASRDHDTFCVSCHTIATYAIARPALRQALAEAGPSPTEIKLLDNVIKRVRMWKEVEPFYPDQTRGLPKTSESRGTEAILNALIVSSRDALAYQSAVPRACRVPGCAKSE